MKSKRTDYASSAEWLADVKKDDFWLSELQALQNSTPNDLSNMCERAMRKLGQGLTFEFWDSKHDVARVVELVWAEESLSLPKLMMQTIGMLMLEWIEQHEVTKKLSKLETNEANKYWQRLVKAGFVDDKHELMPETTRKQAMCIAEVFARKFGIKSKWKTFEQLWGISNLAQEKWDMQETGSMPSRSKEIDKIFMD
jgi:hypothetical protein